MQSAISNAIPKVFSNTKISPVLKPMYLITQKTQENSFVPVPKTPKISPILISPTGVPVLKLCD